MIETPGGAQNQYTKTVEQDGNKITFRVTTQPSPPRSVQQKYGPAGIFCLAFVLLMIAAYLMFWR